MQDHALEDIAEALIDADKVDEALTTTRQMTGEESKQRALYGIPEKLAKLSTVDKALSTLKAVERDDDRELVELRKVDEGVAIARRVIHQGFKEQALFRITEKLVDLNRVDEAEAVARSIKDGYLLSISLASVVKGLVKKGNSDAATNTLNEALTTARKANGSAKALSIISIDLAEAGRTDEALRVARPISDANEQAWAYEAIAEALAKAGKPDEALKVALSIGDNFGNRFHALAAVAKGLAQAGKVEQALAIANKRFQVLLQ